VKGSECGKNHGSGGYQHSCRIRKRSKTIRLQISYFQLYGTAFLGSPAKEPSAKYATVLSSDTKWESKLLASVPVESVAQKLHPLLARGWRPFAIAVDSNVLLTLRREDSDGACVGDVSDERCSPETIRRDQADSHPDRKHTGVQEAMPPHTRF